MAKTIYRREKLEQELGHVGAQNFMSKQARNAMESIRVNRVVRVFNGEGKRIVMDELIIVFRARFSWIIFNGDDMAKVKAYEFWMVHNKMYASMTIKRVHWWNKRLTLSCRIVLAKCKFKAIDITDEDALIIEKIEFEEDGYYEEIMGVRV